LFISSHQEGIYPLTGAADETGAGAGLGTNINLPLPAGAGDQAMARLMGEIIRPAAERFRPNLILVSAGFDAHWLDPLAGLQFTLSGYAQLAGDLAQMTQAHCPGRLVFVLEGGYHLAALTGGVTTVLRVLLGETHVPDSIGPAPRPEPDLRTRIDRFRRIHAL
jgi:acetoin utilization deacetylase AcuC-like enzyme